MTPAALWQEERYAARADVVVLHLLTMRGFASTRGTNVRAPPGLVCTSRSASSALFAAVQHFWLGWLDSNQRMRESKSRALPLGYTPMCRIEARAGADAPALSHSMGWVMGLEPTTPGTTIRCSAN